MRTVQLLAILLITVPAAATDRTQVLVWHDEFNGPAGSRPNAGNWVYDLGGGGWGNNELQIYTDAPENAHLDGHGHLKIEVLSAANRYTSARIKTQSKFEFQFGRIEARIKVAAGRGLWSAFWMLGADFPGVPWPQCGEIDVMEYVGRDPTHIYGTLHGPGYSSGSGISATYSTNKRFSDNFHRYAVEWEPEMIRFFVDDKEYSRIRRQSLPKGAAWSFDHPFFLILDLAVGGGFAGPPDETSQFPQGMLIDWVRIWEKVSPKSL